MATNKRDLIASAQTGSGKTSAYLLPILTIMKTRIINCIGFKEIKKPTVVIFGPTRELMAQIYNEVYNLASKSIICPFVVYGGVHLSTIVTI